MTHNEWDKLLQPYVQAVDELKVKLRGMRTEFELAGIKTPVEFVTGRVKAIPLKKSWFAVISTWSAWNKTWKT